MKKVLYYILIIITILLFSYFLIRKSVAKPENALAQTAEAEDIIPDISPPEKVSINGVLLDPVEFEEKKDALVSKITSENPSLDTTDIQEIKDAVKVQSERCVMTIPEKGISWDFIKNILNQNC